MRSWARGVGWLVYVFQGAFVILLTVRFSNLNFFELTEQVPTWLKVLLIMPLLSLALTPVLVYFSVRGFRGELYAPLARLHYWVLTLVALLVLTLEWHWNVLGFRF